MSFRALPTIVRYSATLLGAVAVGLGCRQGDPLGGVPPPLPEKQITGMHLNDQPAGLIARSDGREGLSASDLVDSFGLGTQNATAFMKKLESLRPGGNFHIRFGPTLIRSMRNRGKCLDGVGNPQKQRQATCLAVDIKTPQEEKTLKRIFDGWNPENTVQLASWYGFVTGLENPATQGAVLDWDDTNNWDSIGPKFLKVAVEMGIIKFPDAPMERLLSLNGAGYVMEKFGLSEVEFRQLLAGRLSKENLEKGGIKPLLRAVKNPYDWWKFLSENTFPALDADYLGTAFGGLKIGDILTIYQRAREAYPHLFRGAYPQMRTLANDMVDRGMCVAIVSSSSFIEIALAAHDNGYRLPLYMIEGTDFYVVHPKSGKHVLFTDLVNTEYLSERPNANIRQVLEHYKEAKILSLVDPVQSGGEGKGASANSIFDRHVAHHNRKNPNDRISREEMRLALFGGDNTRPRSDLPGHPPVQGGNDQGLFRAVIPGEYLALMNIDRGTGKGPSDGPLSVDYSKKAVNMTGFDEFVREALAVSRGLELRPKDTVEKLRERYPNEMRHVTIIHQGAISRGDGAGKFDLSP